jgi:hypothetical protein
MCTALIGQLHSIVGTYMHQRLLQSNCETSWELTLIRTLGGTLGIIPTHSQALTKLSNTQSVSPEEIKLD